MYPENRAIYARAFAILWADGYNSYRVTYDGYYEAEFSAPNDERAIEKFTARDYTSEV